MNKTIASAILGSAVVGSVIAFYLLKDGQPVEWKLETRTQVIDVQGSTEGKATTVYYLTDGKTECNCGTIKNLAKHKLEDATKDGCDGLCAKAFAAKDKRCAMCEKDLCRYGLSSTKLTDAGAPESCDPDAEKCVPWPCIVTVGVDPASIAADPELVR